jgi:hypothetical protein
VDECLGDCAGVLRQQEEMIAMGRKLTTTVAPLLVLATFALAPTVAQAAPHYFVNGTLSPEGVKVTTLSYGLLGLGSSAGRPIECLNVVGGYVENPVGGGAGVGETNGWAVFNCTDGECEAGGGKINVIYENEKAPGQVAGKGLNWPSELTEVKAKTIRLKSSNVRVYTHCQFVKNPRTEKPATGPFTGLEEVTSVEYNSPGSTTCTTSGAGVDEAKLENGSGLEKPSKVNFDTPAFNSLECGASKGFTSKVLKTAGYVEGELITTR